MMTQLKSYLLQSTELQAMVEPQHQNVQDKLGDLRYFIYHVFCLFVSCKTRALENSFKLLFPLYILSLYSTTVKTVQCHI